MKLSEIYDSYYPQKREVALRYLSLFMGLTGLEPVTPALSTQCSNQLSYRPLLCLFLNIKRMTGIEPA